MVDIVYCEDTRVTKKLLSLLGIKTNLRRLDENIMSIKANELINEVCAGKNVAYCSDAGMPGVSDPGLSLVNLARKHCVAVEILPGPSAFVNAYVASGFACSNIYFGAFLQKKKNDKVKTLKENLTLNAVQIYYESPKRLLDTLSVINELAPSRKISVCRELTKLHEEVLIGNAKELIDVLSLRENIKGECVLVIDCPKSKECSSLNNSREECENMVKDLFEGGMRVKDISKFLQKYHTYSKNDAYNLCLELKDKNF